MKKTTLKLFLSISALILLLFGYKILDFIHWKQLNSTLINSKVAKVILECRDPIELKDEEKSDFIKDLHNAKFYKTYTDGGTTGPIITILYNDGSKNTFEYWGNAIFETTNKGSQFLIKSSEIEQALKKHNITLN